MPKGIVWVITPFVLNYDDPDALFRPLAEATGLEIRIDDARPLFTEEEMLKELPGVVATIAGSEPYTRRVFENAHDLKIVSRSGVGLNSIDLPAATASGVVVTNAVGQNAVSVAEHTMAILLAAARLLFRPMPTVGQVLAGPKQPAMHAMRSLIEENQHPDHPDHPQTGNHPEIRRAMLWLLQVPTMADSVISVLPQIVANGELGDVLYGSHLLLDHHLRYVCKSSTMVRC